jgi:hypothetical protein
MPICDSDAVDCSLRKSGLYNGLAQFGPDTKLWLFEGIVCTEYKIMYTENFECLDTVKHEWGLFLVPEAVKKTNGTSATSLLIGKCLGFMYFVSFCASNSHEQCHCGPVF